MTTTNTNPLHIAAAALHAATLATFKPLATPEGEGAEEALIKAVKGDRISVMLVDDTVTNVYSVIMVGKTDVRAQSLLDNATIRLPLEYTSGGAELVEGGEEVAQLFQQPALPEGSEVTPAKKGGKRQQGEPTKMQKCLAIYQDKANKDLDKKELCKLFVSVAGCTKMGANTYFLTIHKDATAAGTALPIIPKEDPQVKAAAEAVAANAAAASSTDDAANAGESTGTEVESEESAEAVE